MYEQDIPTRRYNLVACFVMLAILMFAIGWAGNWMLEKHDHIQFDMKVDYKTFHFEYHRLGK